VEQHILTIRKIRLVGHYETIALADIEPLYAPTYPDGGFPSIFKAVTGHSRLKHKRHLFPKENSGDEFFSCPLRNVNDRSGSQPSAC
jgi:hypothetical protein